MFMWSSTYYNPEIGVLSACSLCHRTQIFVLCAVTEGASVITKPRYLQDAVRISSKPQLPNCLDSAIGRSSVKWYIYDRVVLLLYISVQISGTFKRLVKSFLFIKGYGEVKCSEQRHCHGTTLYKKLIFITLLLFKIIDEMTTSIQTNFQGPL
jgi:hypothetical protein